MVGYVRQSSGLIVTGQTIQASHFNNEYNAIEAAFDGSSGHDHTGGSGKGPIISPAGGGTASFLGTTVGGTSDAITITGTTPSNFTLVDKYLVYFRPTGVNTGAVTINVNGTGVIPVKKLSPSGFTPMDAGDLVTGLFTFLVYDQSNNVFQSITTIYEASPVVTNSGFSASFANSLWVPYVMTAMATIVLPSTAILPKYFWFDVQAKGGDVTLTPDAADAIEGLADGTSYVIPQNTSARVYIGSDTNWYLNGTSNIQPVAAGGTGGNSASTARTGLGLVIGTDVQAFNAGLSVYAAAINNATASPGIVALTANNTLSVRTITGTTDRITVTNGNGASGAPTIDIASSYVGQATITTLGTITTGTWTGTTIALAKGGTGATTQLAAAIAILPAQGSANGKYLTSDGTNASWGTIAAGFADPAGNGIVVRTALNVSTARTITGTSNKIDVTNGDGVSGNPTLTISATYIGQNSITTLGTITTGVWTGTTIAIANGGTGQTTANTALNAFLPSQTSNSGKVLTTDGTNTSWASAGAMVYLATVTASSSASASFNNTYITSTYDDYVIIYDSVVPATSTANLLFQTSTNNGSGYDTSNNQYKCADGASTLQTPTDSLYLLGGSGQMSNSSAVGCSGKIYMYNLNNAVAYKRFAWDSSSGTGTGAGAFTAFIGIGARITSTAINAVRFIYDGGNITSGTFKLYGIVKA